MTHSTERPILTATSDLDPSDVHINRVGRITAVGGVLLAVMGGTAACSSPESNNNTQTQTQPSPAETAQAPVVAPETDPTADPTNPANLPEVAPGTDPESLVNVTEFSTNVVEHGMFALLTPEQQGQMRNMESLSVEQFRALDEAQQFQFAEFVYRNNLPILKNRLDMMGKSNVYLDANLDTPEGLWADSVLTYTLISSLDTKTPEDGTIFDSVTAQKLSILKATRTDELGILITNAIDADIATIHVNTPPVIIEGVLQGSYVDITAGTTIVNVFDIASQTNVQSTFKVFDRVTIEGNPVKDALMVLSVPEGDSRYIQNLK